MTIGWLNYEDEHPSILVKDSLTVPFVDATSLSGMWSFITAGSGALGWTNVTGSPVHKPTHDPILGMKAVSSTDGVTEVSYRTQTPNALLDNLHNQGQLSIDIESPWATANDPANGFTGDTMKAQENLISSLSAANNTSSYFIGFAGAFYNSPLGAPAANAISTKDYSNSGYIIGADNGSPKIGSFRRGQFVRLQLGWNGETGFYGIDGLVTQATNRFSFWVFYTLLNNFYLGSDRGIGGSFNTTRWFRNLLISNEAPEFTQSGIHPTIGVLSDSIFDKVAVSGNNSGDQVGWARVQKAFNAKGLKTDTFVSENAGYAINSAHPISLQTVASDVKDYSTVVIVGGVNDCISYKDVTNLDTETLALIEIILGLNGNPPTSTKNVYLTTAIPLHGENLNANYAADQARMGTAVVKLKSVPGLFDAAYPSLAGSVKIIDTNAALQGAWDQGEQYLFIGQKTGSFRDVHLAGHGMCIFGDTVAEAIFR